MEVKEREERSRQGVEGTARRTPQDATREQEERHTTVYYSPYGDPIVYPQDQESHL